MRYLLLLALLVTGCEDRPRTAADGPQLTDVAPAPDLAPRDYYQEYLKCSQEKHEEFIKHTDQFLEIVQAFLDVADQRDLCAEYERKHWKQLQQCRKECK